MTSSYAQAIAKVKTAMENVFAKKADVPKVFYGTCSTEANVQVKEVTTSSNYVLETGTILLVYFTNGQSFNASSSNKLQLKVNNESNIAVNGNGYNVRYFWRGGEIVTFVYDGTDFYITDMGLATTTYFGVTRLEDSVSSTSTNASATPNSVKQAYDLANSKADSSDFTTITATVTYTDNTTETVEFYVVPSQN